MVNPVSICLCLLNISSSRHTVTGITLKVRLSLRELRLCKHTERPPFFKSGHLCAFVAAAHNMKIISGFKKTKILRNVENKQSRNLQQGRGDYRCVLYAALSGEFDVPAVFSRRTQLESTSIKNLTKILLNTNLYRASGRTRRSTDLLGHQKQGKYPINSAHIQDTSGVSQEAPFYCE